MPYLNDKTEGWRGRDTSLQAAREAVAFAPNLREKCLIYLDKIGPANADEIADFLGVHFMSIRPRLTELANQDLIVDPGERHKSALGNNQVVWKLAQDQMEMFT